MDSLLTAILELPVSDRLQLVQEIWENICAHPELLPVTHVQKEELERRLEAQSRNGNPQGVSAMSYGNAF
ncbi:MAG: addiction module protein [Cyanophyceae cyanobacterium]